jgi:anti-sigma factor RsiW
MSCSFEALVALHVEGDLDESERQRVESHLRTCAECWDLTEDLRDSQAIFKSLRKDVPNQAMLSAVRARVLEDVAGMESGSWFSRFFPFGFRQRATLAGIALLIIGGGGLWLGRGPEAPVVPPPPVAVSLQVAPEMVTPPVSLPVSRPPAAKPRIRRQTPATVRQDQEPQQQVTIRLVSDDPNVIIYWLGDEKGD